MPAAEAVVLPKYHGRRGHPVIFRAALYDELLAAPMAGGSAAGRVGSRGGGRGSGDRGRGRDFEPERSGDFTEGARTYGTAG